MSKEVDLFVIVLVPQEIKPHELINYVVIHGRTQILDAFPKFNVRQIKRTWIVQDIFNHRMYALNVQMKKDGMEVC